jgi:hypothetical protein
VIVKPSAFTVSGTVMEALYVPEVPVIVTVKVPGVAVLLAVRVRKLSSVVGLGEKAPVTPAGKPDMLIVTEFESPVDD